MHRYWGAAPRGNLPETTQLAIIYLECALVTDRQHWDAQVPGCSPRGGLSEACGFAATRSGDYICAGNSAGDVRVYDTHSGKQVALVSPIKVSAQAAQQVQSRRMHGSQAWRAAQVQQRVAKIRHCRPLLDLL